MPDLFGGCPQSVRATTGKAPPVLLASVWRRAERQARYRAVRLRWARRLLSLTASDQHSLAGFWGAADLAQRQAEARELLEAIRRDASDPPATLKT